MRATVKIAILILLDLFGFTGLKAQSDTLFWLVAPEVTDSHGDRPVYLRLSTVNQPSIVTVTLPADPTFKPLAVNIEKNSTQTVDLSPFIDLLENKPADKVLNKGMMIQATHPITAYYEVFTDCLCNPEIFVLKGTNALGNEFYTPFQNILKNFYGTSSFEIIGTSDNTTVTITPANDIVGHPANIPFTIVLNKGQTYSATASGIEAEQHLNGSHIVSDKPVAVMIKDDSLLLSTSKDLAGDQIVPVSRIGKKYIAVRGYLNPNDKIFILAVQDDTEIFINGSTSPDQTIAKAETCSYELVGNTMYIETSKPVYVLHMSGFGSEVGIPLLPAIDCTGSSEIGFTRTTDDFFSLIILTKNGNQEHFTLNGDNSMVPASAFSTVDGSNNNWVFASVVFPPTQIATGSGNIISNSQGVFHLGIINGGAVLGCRYGYFSSFRTYSPEIQSDGHCLNAATHFQLSDTTMLVDVKWNFGDILSGPDTTSGLTNPSHIYTNSGTYQVRAIVQSECETDTIYHQITIKPLQPLNLGDDIQVCSGSVSLLDAGSGFESYEWNTGETQQSIYVHADGEYFVRVTDKNNCSNTDAIIVSSLPNPVISLDMLINRQVTINATNGAEPYEYSIDGIDFQVNQTFSDLKPGEYTATVRDANQCAASITFIIADHEIQIPNYFTPNNDGFHDTWEIKGIKFYPEAEVRIFDRFGKLLISYAGSDTGWNGYYNGSPVRSDDYWYVIILNVDDRVYKGHVTLKR